MTAKRVSCQFLITEIYKHRAKIARYAKRPEEEVLEDLNSFLKHISIYDENFIRTIHLKEAKRLTIDIDLYDMDYVALALQTGAILWTGDKKLANHLKLKGFDSVMNTVELYSALNFS